MVILKKKLHLLSERLPSLGILANGVPIYETPQYDSAVVVRGVSMGLTWNPMMPRDARVFPSGPALGIKVNKKCIFFSDLSDGLLCAYCKTTLRYKRIK